MKCTRKGNKCHGTMMYRQVEKYIKYRLCDTCGFTIHEGVIHCLKCNLSHDVQAGHGKKGTS